MATTSESSKCPTTFNLCIHDIFLFAFAVLPALVTILLYEGPTEIQLSRDGATWQAAHWSNYDINSPPPSDYNATQVTISLSRITAKLTRAGDLSLSFVLVQHWSDPRLVVRNEENGEWNEIWISNLYEKNRKFILKNPIFIVFKRSQIFMKKIVNYPYKCRQNIYKSIIEG